MKLIERKEIDKILSKLNLPPLNLPDFTFEYIFENSQVKIKCIIRNKFVKLTPEEWIRQNFLKYLISELQYPKGMIKLEQVIKIDNLIKRCDAIVYDRNLQPFMIIEFKKENVKINEEVLQQIGLYNLKIKAPFIVMTNGLNHIIFKINFNKKKIELSLEIPNYPR